MDVQIWYAIFSTLFGGIYGAFRRLGEVSGTFLLPITCIHAATTNCWNKIIMSLGNLVMAQWPTKK